MARDLICDGCQREVKKLVQVVVLEGGMQMVIVRCDDCMGIALDMFKTFQNFRCN